MYAHGSPRDPVREYMLPRDIRDTAKMSANFRCMRAPLCFVGHSHVPAIYYQDGTFYRPRAPRDLRPRRPRRAQGDRQRGLGRTAARRSRRLCYVIFDGQHVTFVRLEYDVEAAQRDIRAVAKLPAYLADRLAVGH
jgi:hypothetical protein